MNHTNEYVERLLKAADASGWILLRFDAEGAGAVVLQDNRGGTVEIRTPYGIGLMEYVESFKAQPRHDDSVVPLDFKMDPR